jgi:hypothetical protein
MKKRTLQTISIFFVFGIVAGFMSLVVMTLVPVKFASNQTILSISLLAFVEEIVKFCLLYFIFSTHSLDEFGKLLKLFVFPIFLGVGFSFFELSMIFFGQAYFPLEAFFPTIVHMGSAILLAGAINALQQRGFGLRVPLFILLALFIHICYNVTIVKII